MKSILDPSFRYVKSTDTDLRKTFARVRREQRQQIATPDAQNRVVRLPASRAAGSGQSSRGRASMAMGADA